MKDSKPVMLVGTSLKMYFSHERSVAWTSAVAELLAQHPAKSAIEAFVIPQYPSIPGVLAASGLLAVGAQDVATEDAGAYTGEVSASVLAELGCTFVEVGHAERRAMFGDSDSVVAQKLYATWRNNLTPILCVGERVKRAPVDVIEECFAQVQSAISAAESADVRGPLVVAYEPLWAIGASKPAEDEYIRAVCAGLRERLDGLGDARVIYGGSAQPGLLTRIADSVDGIFLGRFAHDPAAVGKVFDEVYAVVSRHSGEEGFSSHEREQQSRSSQRGN